tara:strand:+ start:123 stop:530 length:408 start_codon:yes stop_codon:yes gene_type:complete
MTMHLVGPWLNTNSTKKRKAKGLTQRDRDALVEHKKYLRSLGIDPDKKKSKKDLRIYMDTRQSKYAEPRNTPYYDTTQQMLPVPKKKMAPVKNRSWKEVQERLEISKQYSIAPAYNKGPYMVVAREDLKTAGKKV